MPRDRSLAVVLAALLVGAGVGGALALGALAPAAPGTTDHPSNDDSPLTDDPGPGDGPAADSGNASLEALWNGSAAALDRFDSRDAYLAYVSAGQRRADGVLYQSGPRVAITADAATTQAAGDGAADAAGGGDGGDGAAEPATAPSRIGTTNVQVAGLDEPDLVKAGERTFYYSPLGWQPPIVDPLPGDDVVEPEDATGNHSPREPAGDTHVVDVSDPAAPEYLTGIDEQGKLLRSGDTLVVLARDHLQAYDVSDPGDPVATWSHPLNASLVTARQQGDTIYLVTKTATGLADPCPIEPLGSAASVPCDEVYRPDAQVAVDATYTALALDAASGEVGDAESFVGTARNSVVYVSGDAIYVTYTAGTARVEVLASYALSAADLPGSVRERIREIRSYDISPFSTDREIRRALAEYWASLPTTEAEERAEAFWEGFSDALRTHQRDLVRTGVVRIGTDGTALAVEAVGEVPGRPLNQFSLSQYDGTLRLTTTIPAAAGAESENDLYVLDAESLAVRGQVRGMGLNERVYSVRYVEDTAYVVTFRRIDPFHVVDLSEPSDPTVTGELKLPGFSSYLHPVDETHVLGVGEEDGRVKAVLFDVSDPSNPTVADTLRPDARWSAISKTHHAFTIDRKHGVFFLPAGERGFVVDYTDGALSVEARVDSEGSARRARYVGDYLYVFGREEIVVLDEQTWERETSLSLGN